MSESARERLLLILGVGAVFFALGFMVCWALHLWMR